MRRRTIQGRGVGTALVACALLIGATFPVLAATSVELHGGASLSVWQDGQALRYAVEKSGSVVRSGRVPGTQDRGRDAFPSLALDPVTGKPILLWSRSDGVALKIAYARFEQGTWKGIHNLTFGPGDDILPLAGSSTNGSYLFFASGDTGQFMFAPLDLSRGRLFAAPRSLLAGLQITGVGGSPGGRPGGPRPEGGTDVPVVIGACDPKKSSTCSGWGTPPVPIGESVRGVTRAIDPFTAIWAVADEVGCSRQVLVVPDSKLSTVLVVTFADGTVGFVGHLLVPAPVPRDFGAVTAASALATICR